jgi:hypothetical protein
MLIHPAIARLRCEGAPQPQVDEALAAWRARPQTAAVMAALAAYGAGEALAEGGALARLLADHGAASAFVAAFIAPLMAALRAEPLAQPAFGFSAMPGLARIRLAESERAALSLAVFACRAAIRPPSVLIEDGEAHEIVLAGAGEAACYRLVPAGGLVCEAVPCLPGTRFVRAGGSDARQIIAVTQPVLLLQLTRAATQPMPSREYSLPEGRLIKTISASKRTSQQMMALGVLGALTHRPAIGAMERLALDAAAERDLRWEALRQVLGMDAQAGMALLARLAARSDDALSPPAAQLQRDLVAAQPELATLEPA